MRTRPSASTPAVAAGLALLGAACGGDVTVSGYQFLSYWPDQPGTTWRYTSADSPDLFEVRSIGPQQVEGAEVTVFEWRLGPQDQLDAGALAPVFATYYEERDGTLWYYGHGNASAEGQVLLSAFPASQWLGDAPVAFGEDGAMLGDAWTTDSGGASWTSTLTDVLDGVETQGGGEFDGVLRLEIVQDAGTAPLAGAWFLGNGFGPVRFEIALQPGAIWLLKEVTTGA